MEKEEFLYCYKKAKNREKRIRDKIRELRERQASAGGIRYSDMPRGTCISDLSDYIVKVENKCNQLAATMERTDKIYEIIINVLNSLDRQEEYEVLYYYYLKGMPIQKIAGIVNMDRSNVYRVRNRALAKLEVPSLAVAKVENLLYA